MNEQRLDEIRARHASFASRHSHVSAFACCSAHAAAEDVPALLAEVDRLRKALSEATDHVAAQDSEIGEWSARVAELEAARPSRFSATPFQVDAFMRTVLAEDTYLRYQQAIGSEAVREAMGDAQSYRNCDDNAQMKQAWRSGIDDALGYIDPDGDGGPYPSQLLCSQHSGGFGPCPGAPKCIPSRDGVS